MGAHGSKAERTAFFNGVLTRQASVEARVAYARDVRAALDTGATTFLADEMGKGVTSSARVACVVRNPQTARVLCDLVAVLKCETVNNRRDGSRSPEYDFDAAVSSLLTRLVEARVSPHFTMLYHANVSVANQSLATAAGDAAPQPPPQMCMLLEANKTTFYDWYFAEPRGEKKSAVTASAIFQVAHALLAAYVTFGVSHNDLHMKNVMGVPVPDDVVYAYEIDETWYAVPLHGWLWKLIDFNHADIGMSNNHGKSVLNRRWAGPIQDILQFMPPRHSSDFEAAIAKNIARAGSLSPAIHVSEVTKILRAALERIGSPISVESVPADRRFSLRNLVPGDADIGDGVTLPFTSAQCYFLQNPERLAPRRVMKSNTILPAIAAPPSPLVMTAREEPKPAPPVAPAPAALSTLAAVAAAAAPPVLQPFPSRKKPRQASRSQDSP